MEGQALFPCKSQLTKTNALKGAQYSLHEVLVTMGFFPAGVQDETPKEESQRLAIGCGA